MRCHRTLVFLVAAFAPVVLSTACRGDCAGVGRPAVELTIRDATTGAGLARDSRAYLFKAPRLSPIDSSVGSDSLTVWLGVDEAGDLDVVVERTGYWPWTATHVRVEKDCVTKTVPLDVRLRRREP